MITPLSFIMDTEKREHWHIHDRNGALCGAEMGNVEWHLPDEPFIEVKLCLACWEEVSRIYPIWQGKLEILESRR